MRHALPPRWTWRRHPFFCVWLFVFSYFGVVDFTASVQNVLESLRELHKAIKNERYLVGRQLHNLERMQTQEGVAPR